MSPEPMAGALYGILACGTLVAVLAMAAVVLVERYLKRRGEVRCVIHDWKLSVLEVGPLVGYRVVFSLEVYLFNQTPSSRALRGFCVMFLRDGVCEVVGRLRDSASDENLEALLLPPRRGVHVSLYASLEGEEARKLSGGFQRAEFVARFPDLSSYKRKIAERGDFVASRKKVGLRRKDFAASWKRVGARRKDFVASWKRVGAHRKDFVVSRKAGTPPG
jgi:hypothetical protein